MNNRNIIVAQSGGPTAAINATLAGVIRAALTLTDGEIYGARHGVVGMLAGELVPLRARFAGADGKPDEEALSLLTKTPAAALGSCRRKLFPPERDPETYETLFRLFEEKNVGMFFYIGGNDSMDTVARLSAYAAQTGSGVRFVGVPKTIDNDLEGTDHTPGYGSAAKFVATVTQEVLCDCAVYATPAVTVLEIMGRDAGWLTAAAALGRAEGMPEPDLTILPEMPFSTEEFLAVTEKRLKLHDNVVIAVSEGARYRDGRYVGESLQSGLSDVFGHKYLTGAGRVLTGEVKKAFGCKVRAAELNILQRCAMHAASGTDLSEAAEIGAASVRAALDGATGVMSVFTRVSDDPYRVVVEQKPVSGIANRVRRVPAEFLSSDGMTVSDACVKYLRPLAVGEVTPEMRGGLPVFFRL